MSVFPGYQQLQVTSMKGVKLSAERYISYKLLYHLWARTVSKSFLGDAVNDTLTYNPVNESSCSQILWPYFHQYTLPWLMITQGLTWRSLSADLSLHCLGVRSKHQLTKLNQSEKNEWRWRLWHAEIEGGHLLHYEKLLLNRLQWLSIITIVHYRPCKQLWVN